MQYLKPDSLNVNLSRIALGCEQLGGYQWGKTSEAEMVRTVRKALDTGINLFDTAPVYGLGHSEELLGKTLGAARKNAIIATKFGYRWESNAPLKKKTPYAPIEKFADSSPANIYREIDNSLKRLRTDYIDIYQVHFPDSKTPVEATISTMMKLKKNGKIRYIGCCNFSLELLKEAMNHGEISCVQLSYNLLDRKIETDILPFCREHNIAVLVYSPLARGLLSGKYDLDTHFTPEDRRGRSSDAYFSSDVLPQNLKTVEKVKFVAGKLNRTPSQVALRWVLENPCITTAIAGAKTVAQVEENAAAPEFSIPGEFLKILSVEI